MPTRLECPYCQTRLEAADSAAGKTAACPKCGRLLRIPAPRAEDSSPIEEAGDGPRRAKAGSTAEQQPREEDENRVEGDGLGKFYGGEKSAGAFPRWALALALFLGGAGLCIFILSRGPNENAGQHQSGARVNDHFARQTHDLYAKAVSAAREQNKQEAIRLYRELVRRLKTLSPGMAETYELDRIVLELKALEAGEEVQTEEDTGQTEEHTDMEGQQQE